MREVYVRCWAEDAKIDGRTKIRARFKDGTYGAAEYGMFVFEKDVVPINRVTIAPPPLPEPKVGVKVQQKRTGAIRIITYISDTAVVLGPSLDGRWHTDRPLHRSSFDLNYVTIADSSSD